MIHCHTLPTVRFFVLQPDNPLPNREWVCWAALWVWALGIFTSSHYITYSEILMLSVELMSTSWTL
jgi:hypothetical protein